MSQCFNTLAHTSQWFAYKEAMVSSNVAIISASGSGISLVQFQKDKKNSQI